MNGLVVVGKVPRCQILGRAAHLVPVFHRPVALYRHDNHAQAHQHSSGDDYAKPHHHCGNDDYAQPYQHRRSNHDASSYHCRNDDHAQPHNHAQPHHCGIGNTYPNPDLVLISGLLGPWAGLPDTADARVLGCCLSWHAWGLRVQGNAGTCGDVSACTGLCARRMAAC